MKTLFVLITTLAGSLSAEAKVISRGEVLKVFQANIGYVSAFDLEGEEVELVQLPIDPASIRVRRSFNALHWVPGTASKTEYDGDYYIVDFDCVSKSSGRYHVTTSVFVTYEKKSDTDYSYQMTTEGFIWLNKTGAFGIGRQAYLRYSDTPLVWSKARRAY